MAFSKLSRSVSGKVVIVTGAASGMGKATAELFAEQGAKVAATDINATPLHVVANAIEDAGYVCKPWVLDVAALEQIESVVSTIAETFGGVDILINNAGIGGGGPVDDADYEEIWARSLDVMVTAHMRMVRAVLPHLRRSDTPRILNIASTEGLGATKFNTSYSTAKTAAIGLTRALAVELGPEGITVNCICPGPIRTGMTDRIPEADKKEYARRRVALKRYADPEEVAQMSLSLCLPAASFVTGVALPVDGGLTIKNA